MEDLLVHSTKCPFCGRTFGRIEEAILKEKEIWHPAEFEPNSWITTTDAGDSWTVSPPGIPYTLTVT